jgi:hypothetical protein
LSKEGWKKKPKEEGRMMEDYAMEPLLFPLLFLDNISVFVETLMKD